MYKLGKGVQPSHENAAYWYEQAAQQSFASAQTQLGLAYRGGSGVAKDFQKAFIGFDKQQCSKTGRRRPALE